MPFLKLRYPPDRSIISDRAGRKPVPQSLDTHGDCGRVYTRERVDGNSARDRRLDAISIEFFFTRVKSTAFQGSRISAFLPGLILCVELEGLSRERPCLWTGEPIQVCFSLLLIESQPILLTFCRILGISDALGRPTTQDVLAYARTQDGLHVTSPNMRYVLDLPRIGSNPVAVCADGRWGIFEYSRWPQEYHDRTAHHMCIPLEPKQQRKHQYYQDSGIDEPNTWFFYQFSHTDWAENPECKVPGYGLVKADVLKPLGSAAYDICKLASTCELPDNAKQLLRQLGLSMRQLLERLRGVPTTRQHTLVAYTHLQRLSLEVFGLFIYYRTYVHRFNSERRYHNQVLPVIGTFTNNISKAETFLRLGVPFWLVQSYPPRNRESIGVLNPWDHLSLSLEPIFPPITSNEVDPRVRTTSVFNPDTLCRGLSLLVMSLSCTTRFPTMPYVDPHPVLSAKRIRLEPSSSSIDSTVSRNSTKSKKRGNRPKKSNSKPLKPPPSLEYEYNRELTWPEVPLVWEQKLKEIGPLRQPPEHVRAVYYWPPPFILETETEKPKLLRFIHNYLQIRQFLRTRLLSPGLGGEPLGVKDWKQALWGNYDHDYLESLYTAADAIADRKAALRNFLARAGSIASYSETSKPRYRNAEVSLKKINEDYSVLTTALWEMREVNFRCELRALDSVILKLDRENEFVQRSRLEALSGVWGATSGGDSVVPIWEGLGLRSVLFYWTPPGRANWEMRRETLYNFARFMTRWPGFPQASFNRPEDIKTCEDVQQFKEWEKVAVEFYITTFVSYFHRLPVPPAICPFIKIDVQ